MSAPIPPGRPRGLAGSPAPLPPKAQRPSQEEDDEEEDEDESPGASSTRDNTRAKRTQAVRPIAREDETPTAQKAAREVRESRDTSPSNSSSQSQSERDGSSTAEKDQTQSPHAGGIFADVSMAQMQASADINTCQQLQAKAVDCCTNPLSCASNSDQQSIRQLGQYAQNGDNQGLADYCRQMQDLGDSSGSINSRLGAICTNNYYACTNSCASLQQKYQSYLASCSNCESYSVFSLALATLNSYSNTCSGLQGRANSLSRAGLSTASNSAYGDYCSQMASVSPMMPSSLSKAKPSSTAVDVSACARNPNAPGCASAPSATAQAQAIAQGQAGFQSVGKSSKGRFNFGDLADSAASVINSLRGGDPAPTANVKPVPNGGGGFGAIGAGGSARADLGPNARRNPTAAASAGNVTDVEQGLRTGGYSQPVGSTSGEGGSVAAYGDVNKKNLDPQHGGYMGMDLKQYLPGGSRDPGRRLAGASAHSQINVKEEDIWRRISIKIDEKCKLGLLWRCR